MLLKLLQFYHREIEGPKFFILLVSFVVAGANGLLITTINTALAQRQQGAVDPMQMLIFVGCLACVLGGGYFTIYKATEIIGRMMHKLRNRIADRIAESSTRNIESFGEGRLYANIAHDIERVGAGALRLVSVAQSAVLVTFCFVYIGWLSPVAIVIILSTTALAVGVFLVSRARAHAYVDEISRSESVFFAALKDLLSGIKEIRLHDRKRDEVRHDVRVLSQQRQTFYARTELLFYRANIISQAAIFAVMAGLIFVPGDFIASGTLVHYQVVTAVLFAISPLTQILDFFGPAIRASVSLDTLMLLDEALKAEERHYDTAAATEPEEFRELRLDHVTMRYSDDNTDFVMGPVDLSLKSGETLFIMGGNGSGKTTLLKILCGLYYPDEGVVSLNGEPVDRLSVWRLRRLFSAVFSDFHLFNKLYGLTENELAAANDYLERVEMAGKTAVEDGRFTKIDLSSGQRKRLALVTLMMEDRPIAIFDEFAADQDPEFREKFYRSILPELKSIGKTVIAITHDDAYQDCCDILVKMDKGKIIETFMAPPGGTLQPVAASARTRAS